MKTGDRVQDSHAISLVLRSSMFQIKYLSHAGLADPEEDAVELEPPRNQRNRIWAVPFSAHFDQKATRKILTGYLRGFDNIL